MFKLNKGERMHDEIKLEAQLVEFCSKDFGENILQMRRQINNMIMWPKKTQAEYTVLLSVLLARLCALITCSDNSKDLAIDCSKTLIETVNEMLALKKSYEANQ